MLSIAAFSLALVPFLLVPFNCQASHYRIADVPDVIQKEYHQRLSAHGVQDTRALYSLIAGKSARRGFAKKSKIMYATLTKWATFIDLMRVDGIGPKMVRLLHASSVKNLRSFRTESAESLQPRMRKANRGGKYSEVIPGVEVIRGWLVAAQSIPLLLE
jgi:hypothetical protein